MFGKRGDSWQDLLQMGILIGAFVCVPLMLLPKPIILINQHKKVPKSIKASEEIEESLAEKLNENEKLMESPVKDNEKDNEHDAGEIFVHQLIETIEFVLGAVSNTASYLRLWALSLAHSQLALVFFEKTLMFGFTVKAIMAVPIVALS